MRSRTVISLLVVLGLVAVIVLVNRRFRAEPSFHGKTASDWFKIYLANNGKNFDEGEVHDEVHYAFQRMGVETVPLLVDKLKKKDSTIARMLFALWSKLPAPIRDRVTIPMPARFIRLAALGFLRGMEVIPEASVPAIIQMAKNDEPDLRAEALKALGWNARLSREMVTALTSGLQDQDVEVRAAAAESLFFAAAKDQASHSALIRALSDPHPSVRIRAVRSLAFCRLRVDDGIPALVCFSYCDCLHSSSARLRAADQSIGLDTKA